MKLIIQICCFNEEQTLPITLAALPKTIPGIDSIETHIIDDGSSDNTVVVARHFGVTRVFSLSSHQGLAFAFKRGVDEAIAHGADILVNTDADNQYNASDIARIVEPVINHTADMVIGSRPLRSHPDFNTLKKAFQLFGNFVIRKLFGVRIADATSGFRAYSRKLLPHINVYTQFSYTLETLIQASYAKALIKDVPISVNPKTRPSRLFKSIPHFLRKQFVTVLHVTTIYRAARVSFVCAGISLVFSLGLLCRYVILTDLYGAPASSFWPSLVFSAVFFALAFQFIFAGILSIGISACRKLAEEINSRLKKSGHESC